jgi:hypothetical protein
MILSKYLATFFCDFTNNSLRVHRGSDWAASVKILNVAISTSSQELDSREIGFSDALIMLSEAYSALGRTEDALRSARLAVSLSHEYMDRKHHNNNVSGIHCSLLFATMLMQ